MYRIITIERQYASGGNEIGRKLAEKLGYELYDRNLLSMAAKELQIPSMYIEGLEETQTGGFWFNLSKTPLGGNKSGRDQPMTEKLFETEKRIIEETADQGGCIIVGRAAGYILKDRKNCLNVFIHCGREQRIERAIQREGIKASEAEDVLKKNDKRRSGFYNSVTNWEWGHPAFFEVCLDSGKLGIDTCVQILEGIARG